MTEIKVVKPHISPSSLDAFMKCPERWKRERLDGVKPAKNINLVVGNAVHSAARINFEYKRSTGEDVDLEYLQDSAVHYLSEVCATEGVEYSDEFQESGDAAKILDETTDVVRGLVKTFREQIAPEYNPSLIEHRFRIPLEKETHDLLGVIDLAEFERDTVVDIKTAGKKWSQDKADTSDQFTFYGLAYPGIAGRKVGEIRVEVITKTKFERQCVRTYRNDAHSYALIYRVRAMLKMINAGDFPPASPDGWWCSKKMCPHWDTCPYTAAPVMGVKIPLRTEVGVSIDSPINAEPMDVGEILRPHPLVMIRKIATSVRDVLFDQNPRCSRCNNMLNQRNAVLQAKDILQPLSIDNGHLMCPVCAIQSTMNEEF